MGEITHSPTGERRAPVGSLPPGIYEIIRQYPVIHRSLPKPNKQDEWVFGPQIRLTSSDSRQPNLGSRAQAASNVHNPVMAHPQACKHPI